MHRILICCGILVCTLQRDSAGATQKAETEEGREVILYEDGRWVYAVEEYERKYLGTIQSGYLYDYPGKQIGEAFEEFFKLPEWRFEEEPNRDQKVIVFTGRLRRAETFKTVHGMNRLFAENAPVKVEFTILGPNSFEVKYTEIGMKSDERWTPKEVRVDLLLDRVYGRS